MDLALARIKDNLGQLRGPIQRSTREALKPKISGRVTIAHLRYCVGAALAIALVGIAVNALLLQRERHPAPLFGSAAPKPQAAAPAAAPAPAPKSATTEEKALSVPPAAALPQARPAATAQSSAPAPDPIAALLAGETPSDSLHLTVAAQTALAKLGYPIKPDGKEGAETEQALRDFEHAHGLPSTTEITERLVKQLTQAARNAGR